MNWRISALLFFPVLISCTPNALPGWAGYVEGDYVYIAAPLAGTLIGLPVKHGQKIAAGDNLFTLESVSEHAAHQEARARLDAARAQAENLRKGLRKDEIAVIEAKHAQAKSQASLAVREYRRQVELVDKGFTSAAKLDEMRMQLVLARAKVSELDAAVRVASLPGRLSEQQVALAQIHAAEQALLQTDWREQQKSRQARVSGLVAQTYFRVGELVPVGRPIVSILPEGQIKVRFFVPETAVAALSVGDSVEISCDGCSQPIGAKIDFIATEAEYTPPVIYSNSQRAKLVFMIEARPVSADASALKPGLPVEVRALEPAS